MNERLQEMARFEMTLKREFPGVTCEMAKDITRGGRVTESTSRLICRCSDWQARNQIQARFYTRRSRAINDTTLVFEF